jgi:Xaa-Pro aminopeptidase
MFQSFEKKSDPSEGVLHVKQLRSELAKRKLDGFVIPHDDEFQNEYLPANAERLAWISGFTGSAGACVVMQDKAAIFVDSRYTLAVREEVDTDFFEIYSVHDTTIAAWIEKNTGEGQRIGYDPNLHSDTNVDVLSQAAKKAGAVLQACDKNPLDQAWTDRPDAPLSQMTPYDIKFAGKASDVKRREIGKALANAKTDALVLTKPDSIAWLFNVRGSDVAHTPLSLSQAILYADGHADLFIDSRKVGPETKRHLGNEVTLNEPADFRKSLSRLGEEKKRISVDPSVASALVFQELKSAGADIKRECDPCALPKAIKNTEELAGIRAAHIRDGGALSRFLCWLSENAATGDVDEIGAVRQLETFRRDTGHLEDISFDTISGAADHGAIVHYRVTEQTNQVLKPNSLFLVDSGAQYKDGTTDVTRTIVIGEPTDEQRDRFTRVLKGHIQLASVRFPKGTTGGELDVLARHSLWAAGIQFEHGTGHGVGCYLGVHEGPQSISKRGFNVALEPGMVVSNEPGYYKSGEYGIRIENLVTVTPPTSIEGGEVEMLGFETLTLAPIDLALVDARLLTEDETSWLNAYHRRVRETVSPIVDAKTADWIKTATRAL